MTYNYTELVWMRNLFFTCLGRNLSLKDMRAVPGRSITISRSDGCIEYFSILPLLSRDTLRILTSRVRRLCARRVYISLVADRKYLKINKHTRPPALYPRCTRVPPVVRGSKTEREKEGGFRGGRTNRGKMRRT